MTVRGRVLLLVSVIAVAAGWRFNWPEIAALGAAGIAAVIAIVLMLGTKPRGTLSVDQESLRVVRLQSASVRVTLDSDRPRRAMRLVEGVDASNPTGSVRITRAQQASTSSLRFPLDTSQRGQRPMGPFTLVQGDPWGIVVPVAHGVSAFEDVLSPKRQGQCRRPQDPSAECALELLSSSFLSH